MCHCGGVVHSNVSHVSLWWSSSLECHCGGVVHWNVSLWCSGSLECVTVVEWFTRMCHMCHCGGVVHWNVTVVEWFTGMCHCGVVVHWNVSLWWSGSLECVTCVTVVE